MSNSHIEQPPKSPSQSPVAPVLSTVFNLAELHGKVLAAESFLDELQAAAAAEGCDSATSAVLTLWVRCAREALSRADAAACVRGTCQRIAKGEERPGWWGAVSRHPSGH
ncbi:hypothetical protein [Piscinibacter terrae]|uniref:hypothetical protein n=1 Tax=Piscinibacter terrae TaxID=2496871 RepID=UPI000F5B7772|nr:hypothetical protein [Albitalea terrae]